MPIRLPYTWSVRGTAKSGLTLGSVYAVVALGYTMVYGIIQLINFAHGDVFMVGAFTSFYAVSQFKLHQWPQMLFPAMPAGLSVVIGSITVILLLFGTTSLVQAFVKLRDTYAPNVLLAWHLSDWGTMIDLHASQTSDAGSVAVT